MASDDFNRGDNADLGANWNVQTGASAMRIATNAARPIGTGLHSAEYWNGGTPGNNQYAQGVLANALETQAGDDPDFGMGPAIRMTTGDTRKYGAIGSGDAAREVELVEWDNAGGMTILGTYTGGTPALGDVLRLEGNGTTIRVLVDGVERISVTDATLSSGEVGICGRLSIDQPALDDWDGGTLYAIEQEAFRARNDDGDEDAATWYDAEDANFTAPLTTNRRLRILLNGTGDAPTIQFRLDYKKSTDSVYRPVRTADLSLSRSEITAGQSTSNIQTHTTASVTLQAGRLYLLAFAHSDTAPENAASSVATTGGAVSFTSVTSVVYDTIASNVHRLELWRVIPSVTVTDTIAINLGDAGTGCAWILQEYQNPDETTPLGTPATNNVNGSTSISATPGALNRNVNHQIAFGAHDLNSTSDTASGTNWSSVGTGQTYNTPATAIECAENTSGSASQVTFSGAGSSDRAVIAVEVRTAPREAILLSASGNIAASGEATTAQLTAPSGKSTSDFVAGRMQDDENPADTVDITADDYTELEWCLTAVSGVAVNADIYQFRVTENGSALSTYTLTPEWTIGTPAAPVLRDLVHTLLHQTIMAH